MLGPATHPHDKAPVRAVLVSEDTSARDSLAGACEAIGIVPVTAHSAPDAAAAVHLFDAPLVVVLADHLQTSPSALFEALRPSTPRVVMFGPPFGGVEHVLALELGFHEVWPADLTPLALNALLCSIMRGPRAESKTSVRGVAFGDFQVDPVGLTCFDGKRPVVLGTSCLQTLALLVERAPEVVSREELRAVMPSVSGAHPAGSRVVDVHVSRIRRLLQSEGVTSVRISQVRGRGYRVVHAP